MPGAPSALSDLPSFEFYINETVELTIPDFETLFRSNGPVDILTYYVNTVSSENDTAFEESIFP
eukprot:scaffold428885_cov22-Prasinocladus_malaysianus.AAC.1